MKLARWIALVVVMSWFFIPLTASAGEDEPVRDASLLDLVSGSYDPSEPKILPMAEYLIGFTASAEEIDAALNGAIHDLTSDRLAYFETIYTIEELLKKDSIDKTRYIAAIKPLMKHVGYGGMGRSVSEAAERAIVLIGKPALPEILEIIRSNPHNGYSGCPVACIRMLTKIDPEQALQLLPDLLDAETSRVSGGQPNWQVPSDFFTDELRRTAITCLGEFGPLAKSSVKRLKQYLDDPNILVREETCSALIRITDKTSPYVELLTQMVLDPKAGRDPLCSVWPLSNLGDKARDCYPAFIKAFSDPDPEVRKRAVKAMYNLGAKTPDLAAGLLHVLEHDSDPTVRELVPGALAMFGPVAAPALPALTKALDADPPDGERYAYAISEIQSDDTFPPLFRALKSRHEQTRISAAWNMGCFPTHAEQTIPVLRKLASDPNEKMREAVKWSLDRLQPPSSESKNEPASKEE